MEQIKLLIYIVIVIGVVFLILRHWKTGRK